MTPSGAWPWRRWLNRTSTHSAVRTTTTSACWTNSCHRSSVTAGNPQSSSVDSRSVSLRRYRKFSKIRTTLGTWATMIIFHNTVKPARATTSIKRPYFSFPIVLASRASGHQHLKNHPSGHPKSLGMYLVKCHFHTKYLIYFTPI